MSSEVDVCNVALAHLGDEATVAAISPPDGSVQAGHCSRFYPIARDELLELHNWRFNTQRAVLSLNAAAPPIGWAYAYSLPSLCVKPVAVLMPNALPDLFSTQPAVITPTGTDTTNAQDFVVEASPIDGTAVLYTNVQNATLLYTLGVTDTAKFTPLFRRALARLLASYLAGPIIKGVTGANTAKAMLQIFHEFDLPAAVTADANARKTDPYSSATPAAISARL